jgi:hypothetical protein
MFEGDTISKDAMIAQKFRAYLVDIVCPYLRDRFSVYLKKEVLNLISLIANLPFIELIEGNNSYVRNQLAGKKETILDRVIPSLKYVKKMHFPLRSRDLENSSNAA